MYSWRVSRSLLPVPRGAGGGGPVCHRRGRLFDPAAARRGEEVISKIEAGVQRMGPVTPVLEQGVDARGLLQAVLSEFQLEFLESHPVEYRCYCSRDRVTRA